MPHPNNDIGEILQKTAVKADTSVPETPETETKSKQERPPSREGKKSFTTHFNKDAHSQLKMMAIEQGTSMHDLMISAVNTLFELNNKPPIA